MKKLLLTLVMAALVSTSIAAEKKAIKDINTESFTSDTQTTPKNCGDNHIAIAWWIPHEFWQSILARDTTTSEADKNSILKAMSEISLLAIVQADISNFGAFKFYSKEEIETKMKLSYSDAKGNKVQLSLLQNINPDLQVFINVFKPMLGAAMGNLGTNLHFYVLSDKNKSSSRLLDPYKKGKIDIQLARRDKVILDSSIVMPINALFIPRKCPNGKEAHISWTFCPWTGKRLPE